jgi:hypothetical protein
VPYKRQGRKIYVKKRGKWQHKSTAANIANAKKMLRLLKALKHKG